MPQYAIQRLYELTKDRETYITTEVGQHQMWAAQFYHFEEPNRWMTSGGLGTMGYGLPAAIGVQVAHRGCAGHRHCRRRLGADDHPGNVDGGAVRLPMKIFILNNQYMGMVRQWQQLLHGNRCRIPTRRPAGLRQAGRSLWRRRHPGAKSPASWTMRSGDDRHAAAGDLRLPWWRASPTASR
jgi:hypothetical protein